MTDRQCEPVLGRILLYVHDIEGVAEFYALHFGFRILKDEGDRIVELESPDGAGNNIMLHPLGRGRKSGQTVAKLVFDIPDVTAFCARAARHGLEFGPIHKGGGYVFANAKDPAGNSVSVSSRAFPAWARGGCGQGCNRSTPDRPPGSDHGRRRAHAHSRAIGFGL